MKALAWGIFIALLGIASAHFYVASPPGTRYGSPANSGNTVACSSGTAFNPLQVTPGSSMNVIVTIVAAHNGGVINSKIGTTLVAESAIVSSAASGLNMTIPVVIPASFSGVGVIQLDFNASGNADYIQCIDIIAQSNAASTWKVVEKDFAAIGLSVSFQTNLSGWVAGGSSDGKPLLLYTNDGGKTLKNDPVADASNGEFLSIDLFDSQHGIAGALGFGGLPCGAFTNDGTTWVRVHDGVDIVCAVQDSKAPAANVFVMIGQFSHPLQLGGDGIEISLDGGKSWKLHNWNQNTSARYGWFESGQVGILTGGNWPGNNNSALSFPWQVTQHIYHTGKKHILDIKAPAPGDGYQALIAATTNGGVSWVVLVNMINEGIYFNEISCVDRMTCWVVAEGVNKTTGVQAAYIFGTSDGFNTIQQQHYFEHGSLLAVNMLNSTFGWAGGADLRRSGLTEFTGTFFLTTDGKTWTQNQQIGNFYAFDISTVNVDYAYASGLDEAALAELVQYAP